MRGLEEHYQEALTIFPEEKIVGIFVQGSQNYGLDYIGSDIDTKCIVLPTLEDICLNKDPKSYTHVRKNNEHIDFKDLRVIIHDFRKQNINFLEILYTPYRILNPKYFELFKPILDNDDIAHIDNHRFVRAVAGMSMEKHKALTLDRPSQHEEIEKYGWATKQLHHMIRLNTFLKRYISGVSFVECLRDPNYEELRYLKQYGHTIHDLEKAKKIAKEVDEKTNEIKEEYVTSTERIINEKTNELLDSVTYNVLKAALKEDILR